MPTRDASLDAGSPNPEPNGAPAPVAVGEKSIATLSQLRYSSPPPPLYSSH